MAPSLGRTSKTERCSSASLVGGSPATCLPERSILESWPGESSPSEELVGVISQPSATRALILPDVPGQRPRAASLAPSAQIASRVFDSVLLIEAGTPW